MFRLPCEHIASVHAGYRGKAYVYCFAQHALIPELKAAHAIDAPYALGTVSRMRSMVGVGSDVDRLSTRMMLDWCSFARTGKMPWEAWDPKVRNVMYYGKAGLGLCKVVNDPLAIETASWGNVMERCVDALHLNPVL